MAQKHLLFTVLLLVSIVLSGCSPSPTPETATPTLTPTPEINEQQIVDLVEQGTITFKIISGAINELGLDIQNTTNQPVDMIIPAGTYFVNEDPKFQNMVIRRPVSASLQRYGQAEITLEAACANLHLTEPTQENTFTIQRIPGSYQLAKIIDELNITQVDYPVEQAAIWIVTDDATFDELGMLVEGTRFGTSIINEEVALRAMMLVDQAGLNIREYAIWGDHSQLMVKVTDPELSAWLSDQVAMQAVEEATQAVETATQMAKATPTPEAEEISQYATGATASSQYTATDWSAMQAIGLPDVIQCENNPLAWKSLNTNVKEWLLLNYDQAVIPTKIVIHQAYHPGAVSLVEVIDEAGDATSVYEATPAMLSQCPYDLEIEVKNVDTLVRSVRVTVDQTNQEGKTLIDAVQLIGLSK
jgi:hypothetical protein